MFVDKKTNELLDEIKGYLGNNLQSFIVYGSAATGERYKGSDINVIIILENIGVEVLQTISKPVKKFVVGGNPVPLFFTLERLLQSEDVFPVEFYDIKDNHKTLYGKDVFKNIKINDKNLRLELEREFKSKLIRLRQSYILTEGKSKPVKKLLAGSISTFIALGKGLLRLNKKKVPNKKKDVIKALAKIVNIDTPVFYKILSYKEGIEKIDNRDTDIIFKKYMMEIERLADYTDSHGKKTKRK